MPKSQRRAGKRVTGKARDPGYVMVPAREYEMLVARDMAREADAIIARSGPEDWLDAERVLSELRQSRITEARKRRGLSQRALSAKAKMPQSQVSRIERNPDSTTLRQLKRIAEALGVPVADLV